MGVCEESADEEITVKKLKDISVGEHGLAKYSETVPQERHDGYALHDKHTKYKICCTLA